MEYPVYLHQNPGRLPGTSSKTTEMKKFTLISVLVSALTFFALPCFAQKDKGFNFPEGFGSTETTVLISPGSSDKITEAMTEAFEKEYKGKYEAIASSTVPKNKSDLEKYRYVFFVTEVYTPAKFVGRDRWPATTDYKFGLRDMKTGESYQTEFLSGSYKKGAKYYVEHLEEFRIANGGK